MKMFRVFNMTTGAEVKRGDMVTSFHDETYPFDYATRANDDHRDGKVVVKGLEYYARVFDLRVEEA